MTEAQQQLGETASATPTTVDGSQPVNISDSSKEGLVVLLN